MHHKVTKQGTDTENVKKTGPDVHSLFSYHTSKEEYGQTRSLIKHA